LPAGKELLGKQQRYFIELRQQVKAGIDKGLEVDDIIKSIDMPWHKEWTGIEARERVENIKHVFDELTGRVMPYDLAEDLSVYAGPSPTKATPGWKAPRKIVVPPLMPARLLELKRLAPQVQFVAVKTEQEAAREASDADAVLGYLSPEIVSAGKHLRWIQLGHGGTPKDVLRDLSKSDIALTDLQRIKLADPPADVLDRQWRLFRENVRRFVAGEALLCVVDKAKAE
jgi:hypothetical protein